MKNACIIVLSVMLFGLLSCLEEPADNNLTIISGTQCGWCAGTDSLIITKTTTIYSRNFPCSDDDYTITQPTKSNVWNELKDKLDLKKFRKVNLNSCNYCADGCDTHIRVITGDYNHKIRYGYSDTSAINSISPLTEMLDSIRESYRKESSQPGFW